MLEFYETCVFFTMSSTCFVQTMRLVPLDAAPKRMAAWTPGSGRARDWLCRSWNRPSERRCRSLFVGPGRPNDEEADFFATYCKMFVRLTSDLMQFSNIQTCSFRASEKASRFAFSSRSVGVSATDLPEQAGWQGSCQHGVYLGYFSINYLISLDYIYLYSMYVYIYIYVVYICTVYGLYDICNITGI